MTLSRQLRQCLRSVSEKYTGHSWCITKVAHVHLTVLLSKTKFYSCIASMSSKPYFFLCLCAIIQRTWFTVSSLFRTLWPCALQKFGRMHFYSISFQTKCVEQDIKTFCKCWKVRTVHRAVSILSSTFHPALHDNLLNILQLCALLPLHYIWSFVSVSVINSGLHVLVKGVQYVRMLYPKDFIMHIGIKIFLYTLDFGENI